MKKYYLLIIILLFTITGCSNLITVTIKDEAGHVVDTIKVEKGKLLDNIPIPKKEGYIFTSWTKSGNKIAKDTILKKDIIITANYTEQPSILNTYKIKFIIDEEEKYQTIIAGEKVKEPTQPKKNKYTFLGWYQNNKKYDFSTIPTSDLTLIAKFEKNMITINYDLSGGVGTTSYDIKINTIPKRPANPKKEGYKFISWTINNKEYDFNKPLSSDTTLTASWQAIKYIRISFNTDGGNIIKDKYIEANTKLNSVPTPKKPGYTFKYWTNDGIIFDFSKEIVDNITLKAIYEKN